jgi:hypothetical protein
MVHHFKVFLLFLLAFEVFAQDERYYRQILKGELPSFGNEMAWSTEEKFSVDGAQYLLDLNGDGIDEIIQPKKRDGVDWLEIKDASLRNVFEAKLLAMGGDSSIYKIKLAHLSGTVKVLIVFLDEGKTEGRRFESTARIFLIPFENNDLRTMKLTQGPHHFQEKEAQREQYWRRDYNVEVRDVNQDGVRDIIVSYHHIQRIMLYSGKGNWRRL